MTAKTLKCVGLNYLISDSKTDLRAIQSAARVLQHVNEVLFDRSNELGLFPNANRAAIYREFGTWSYRKYDERLPNYLLYGYDWAWLHGAVYGESCISMRQWHAAFINIFQNQLGFEDLDYNLPTQDLEYHLAELVESNEIDKVMTLTNNYKRDWILCWLYVLSADEVLLDELGDGEDGDMLLGKLLLITKLATLQRKRSPLLMLIQFIEALAIGHHYHWELNHSPREGFRLLTGMSETCLSRYNVVCETWMRRLSKTYIILATRFIRRNLTTNIIIA